MLAPPRPSPRLTRSISTDVKTISKFAQLEFKLGDAERGRTIFEGIMDSYSKRLDLWFVYVDMEIKQKNVTGVRALFDRILTQRLSSSQSFPSPSLATSTDSFMHRKRKIGIQEMAFVRERAWRCSGDGECQNAG